MKQFVLFFFLCSVLTLTAQPLVFENSLKTAFEKAKIENKPVFILYYNSDCPVCIQVEKLFNNNDNLIEFYNKSFVSYRIDIHNTGKTDSLFMVNTRLTLTSIPYFLFFDSNQNMLHVSAIEVDVDFLINVGRKALDPNERTAGLENKYNKGDRSIKTLYAYSQLVQLYNNDSLTTILANDLYKSFPKSDLGNRKSYVITKNSVNNIENGFFKFWIKNTDKLVGFEPEKHKGEEKQSLADIVQKSVFSKESENWNLEKIAEVKTYVLLTGLSKNPDAFFWEKETKLLIEQKKYEKALSIGEKMLSEDKTAIQSNLYTIRHFMNLLNTANELSTVKKWLDEIPVVTEDINDRADCMYLNALYLMKIHQTEQAQKVISTALKFYEKNKLDTTTLNELNKSY